MGSQIYTPKTGEFEYGSRALAWLLLISFLATLLYMIYSAPRLVRGAGLEVAGGALVGLVLLGYFAWREGHGFFLARATPAEVELRFLFRSERVSRKHVAGVELRVETANIMDALDFWRRNPLDESRSSVGWKMREERRRDEMDSAAKYRLVLRTHSGQEYVSARFDDEKRFFGLRDLLARPPETGPAR